MLENSASMTILEQTRPTHLEILKGFCPSDDRSKLE
jgi:hypothetical protein